MSTLEVVPSGTRTVDGDQEFNGWTPDFPIVAELTITAVSGTAPSLQLWLDASVDGVNWHGIDTMSATAVGSTQKIFANGDADDRGGMKLRFRWVITGTTPSFTFKTQAYSATEGVR